MHWCREAQQVAPLLDGHAWQCATLREAVTTYHKPYAYRGAQWPDFPATMWRLFAEASAVEQVWFCQEVERTRTALPSHNLAALEATIWVHLTAAGELPTCALDAMVRIQTDAARAERTEMLAFDAWQRAQEEAE